MRANYQEDIRRLMAAVTEGGTGEEALGVVRDFQTEAERFKFSAGRWPRADQLLDDFDINFRLRRAFHITYFIQSQLGRMGAAVLADAQDEEDKLAERYAHIWGDARLRAETLRALRQ